MAKKEDNSPLGVLSRLYFGALRHCGVDARNIRTYVTQYVSREIKKESLLNPRKSFSTESANQQINTIYRAMTEERMTLKTLFLALTVIRCKKVVFTMQIVLENDVVISSEQTLDMKQLDETPHLNQETKADDK